MGTVPNETFLRRARARLLRRAARAGFPGSEERTRGWRFEWRLAGDGEARWRGRLVRLSVLGWNPRSERHGVLWLEEVVDVDPPPTAVLRAWALGPCGLPWGEAEWAVPRSGAELRAAAAEAVGERLLRALEARGWGVLPADPAGRVSAQEAFGEVSGPKVRALLDRGVALRR